PWTREKSASTMLCSCGGRGTSSFIRDGVALNRPDVATGRATRGAVTFVQRFGSSLNLNIHFHALPPDGVFARNVDGTVGFVPIAPPSDEEILAITIKINRPVRRSRSAATSCPARRVAHAQPRA